MSPATAHVARPVVLTIAGFDPSSGAGVTADIKTIAAHGCYGVSCITALTVQSTRGVKRVEPVAVEVVRDTLAEVAADVNIAAVRVGMLATAAVAAAVADFLEERRPPNVVVDPVLKASSGADLIDEDGREVLRLRLFKVATVITPNLNEGALLTGMDEKIAPQPRAVAESLHRLGARNVVVTGGDLPAPVDFLSGENGAIERAFPGERIETTATHGTGCAFATALACNLALGQTLSEAVRLSGEYVRKAMASAYPVGRGKGPVNHLFERSVPLQ